MVSPLLQEIVFFGGIFILGGILILGLLTLRTIAVRESLSLKIPFGKAAEILILVQIAGTIIVTVLRVLYPESNYPSPGTADYILKALPVGIFPLLILTGAVIGWISKRRGVRLGVIFGWSTAVTYILVWQLLYFGVRGVDIFFLPLFGIGVPLLGLKTLKAIRAIDLQLE